MAEHTTLCLEVQLNAADMYRFSITTMFRRFRWVVLLFSAITVYLVFQIARGSFQWGWSFGSLFAPLFFFIFFPYAFFIAPYFSSKKYLQKNLPGGEFLTNDKYHCEKCKHPPPNRPNRRAILSGASRGN